MQPSRYHAFRSFPCCREIHISVESLKADIGLRKEFLSDHLEPLYIMHIRLSWCLVAYMLHSQVI